MKSMWNKCKKEGRKKNQNGGTKSSLSGCFTKIEKKKTPYVLRSKHYGGGNARNAGPAHGRRAGRPFRWKSEQEEVVYGKLILLLYCSLFDIFNRAFFFSRTDSDDLNSVGVDDDEDAARVLLHSPRTFLSVPYSLSHSKTGRRRGQILPLRLRRDDV